MQAKLHRWAAADPGRRFDDLFNFVHDSATLMVAFSRVAGNQGTNTPGVDGLTVAWVEEAMGVPGFLDGLRAQLKTGTFTAASTPIHAPHERSADAEEPWRPPYIHPEPTLDKPNVLGASLGEYSGQKGPWYGQFQAREGLEPKLH